MIGGALALTVSELRRFTRGRTRRAAVVVMVLLPLLYGALYLWAFWNPYGNLGRVPVALVDLDQPVHGPAGTIDAGKALSANLVSGHALGWTPATPAQARRGVARGQFYASLTIPAGFSASVASLGSAEPHPAKLTAELNAASNYVASQLMGSVFASVQRAAATTFSTRYLDHLFVALAGSGASTSTAAADTGLLADAAAQLHALLALYPFGDPVAAHSSSYANIVQLSAQLSTGSRTLAGKLGTAAGHAAPFTSASAPSRASAVASPVTLVSHQLHDVPNYGTAFAPYFIPLALWVGGMMLFFLLRPLSPRALAVGARPGTIAWGGLLPVAVLGMVQAAVVLVVAQFGLGLTAAHPLALWGLALLASVTFAAVLQMLQAVLGAAGRVAGLALLVLQLVSSAGTYPIQTSPGFVQRVQPLMPMTYVVNGMRDAVSGSLAYAGHDVLVLLAWLAVALAVTTVAAARRRVLSYRVVEPDLQMSVT